MSNETAFSQVLAHPDLWKLVKSFMYPGKKTATLETYQDGNIAAYHGYLSLMKYRSEQVRSEADKLKYTYQAMNLAAGNGRLHVVPSSKKVT